MKLLSLVLLDFYSLIQKLHIVFLNFFDFQEYVVVKKRININNNKKILRNVMFRYDPREKSQV
jgi:hypothetical protein